MSQNLIDFLIHFSYLCYNVITYFYAEIWRFYQTYILHIYIEEATIPAKIHKTMISMAKQLGRDIQLRSRQGIHQFSSCLVTT